MSGSSSYASSSLSSVRRSRVSSSSRRSNASDSEADDEDQVWLNTSNTRLAEKIAGIPSKSSKRMNSCRRATIRLFLTLTFFAAAIIGVLLAVAFHFSAHNTALRSISSAYRIDDQRFGDPNELDSAVSTRSFDFMSEHEFEVMAVGGANYTCPPPQDFNPDYYAFPTVATVNNCPATTPWFGGQWQCGIAWCYPGRGYYLEGGSSGYPNPYTWPNNVTGALIPENITSCNPYNTSAISVPPSHGPFSFNGTEFFCLNGTLNQNLTQGLEPPFECINGTLIYYMSNETLICQGALVVDQHEELQCNTTTLPYFNTTQNCTTLAETVYVPSNLLCNESALWGNTYNFVQGSISPPICMIIATPQAILKTTWRPVVDAFTVLYLERSSNRTQWFDCSTAIAMELGGVTSGPRARFDQGNADLGYGGCTVIVPFWTIVIHLDGGTVTQIEWDDECSSCATVAGADNCVMGNCGVTFDQCTDSPSAGPTDCSIKVYVSWTGTDSSGNTLLSSNLRLSQFQEFSLTSSWGQATNWAGVTLPSLPADNGVPSGPRST